MSWWGSSNKSDLPVSIPNLHKYYEIVSGKDMKTEFKPGDIITLKREPFLPDKNAGCSTNPEDENFYACVVEHHDLPRSGHMKLGDDEDLKIAVVCGGIITVTTVDSRLFWKPPSNVIPALHPVMLLRQFAADTPIDEIKEGMLVRPRVNTQIRQNLRVRSFSSYDSEVYKTPLYVLGTKSDSDLKLNTKAILAGYTDSGGIHEIEVDKEMLSFYRTSEVFNFK